MSSSEQPHFTLDVIMQLSDPDLVEFIMENQHPEGSFDLELEGWEDLPPSERDPLADRLRVATRMAKEQAWSRPVSADEVAARLLMLANKDDSSAAEPEMPSFTVYGLVMPRPSFKMELEIDCYNELVHDGCAPPYPVRLLPQVSQNPEEYRMMLLPWQTDLGASPPDWRFVFRKQLDKWQRFRSWQRDNRGIELDDGGFAAFVEADHLFWAKFGTTWHRAWPGRTQEQHISVLKAAWDHSRRARLWNSQHVREVPQNAGLQEYVAAVKHRLRFHGISISFQLERDPRQQSRLTTWIEYLNYEFWWYDVFESSHRRLQRQYNAARDRLMDMGALQPSGTASRNAIHQQEERDEVSDTLKAAERGATGTPQGSAEVKDTVVGPSGEEREHTSFGQRATAPGARRVPRATQRKYGLVRRFDRLALEYEAERENVERQYLKIQWALAHLRILEEGVTECESAATERSSAGPLGEGKAKRPHEDEDDENGGASKRIQVEEVVLKTPKE